MANYLNTGKKQYTEAEKKAFHMGRAWAAGKIGKRVPCPDEKTKQSFRNGVKAMRERKSNGGKKSAKVGQSPLVYSPILGGCLIDSDGCIVKVLNGGKS